MCGNCQEMFSSGAVLSVTMVYFITSTWINGFIIRGPCVNHANFSIVINNFALSGSIIASLTVTDAGECQAECLFNGHCMSINFQEGTQNCQLSGGASYATSVLIEKKGWHFMTTNYSMKAGNRYEDSSAVGKDVACLASCDCTVQYCESCCKESLEVYRSLFISWLGCHSVRQVGILSSGVYRMKLNPNSDKVAFVFCDLESDSHSWLVFQRRIDESMSFERRWIDYQTGFGSPSSNFWLGLDSLQLLTSQRQQAMLRIILKFRNEPLKIRYADYFYFRVGDESSDYMLALSGYSSASTLSDAMTPSYVNGYYNVNGMRFSTADRDNDKSEASNCAKDVKGGWWFKKCYFGYLNGRYHSPGVEIDCLDDTAAMYMTWKGYSYCHGGITFSEMKLRYLDLATDSH